MPRDNITKGKWAQAGVPKKGWRCVNTFDRGHDALELCQMCEQAEVRYAHVMVNDRYEGGELAVGCICAGNMEQDLVRAKDRETVVRNKSQRRANWLKRKGWQPSGQGNPRIKIDGYFVTAFSKNGKWRWSITRWQDSTGKEFKKFSDRSFDTIEKAKLDAFEAFEKITSRS